MTHQLSVLIADDDAVFGRALAKDFEQHGWVSQLASSFDEAVGLAATTTPTPNLAVLDLFLADRSGIELLQHLQKRHPTMTAVIMSGYADPSLVSDAIREGAKAFFAKPVYANAILEELERVQHPHALARPLAVENQHLLSLKNLHGEGVDRFWSLSRDLLCIAGFDNRFRFLNERWQETLGFSIDELCAQTYLSFVHPDDHASTLAEIKRLTNNESTIAFRNRYRCKDGSYKWLWWHAVPSTDLGLIYGAAREITVLVAAERTLKEEEERLRELAQGQSSLVTALGEKNKALRDLDKFQNRDGGAPRP